MTIKCKVEEVLKARAAFVRMFDEVKLSGDALWSVSRLIGKMDSIAKTFSRANVKLYRDAGGTQTARETVSITGIDRAKDESDAEWAKRKEAFRDKMNKLHDDVEQLYEREEEIQCNAIKRSALPTHQENAQGEKVPAKFRATDIADAGPFIVDDTEAKE